MSLSLYPIDPFGQYLSPKPMKGIFTLHRAISAHPPTQIRRTPERLAEDVWLSVVSEEGMSLTITYFNKVPRLND